MNDQNKATITCTCRFVVDYPRLQKHIHLHMKIIYSIAHLKTWKRAYQKSKMSTFWHFL